jgi:hypothetical protein
VFAVATLKLREPLTFVWDSVKDNADNARFLGAVDQCSLAILDILLSVDISLFFSPDSLPVHGGDRLLLKEQPSGISQGKNGWDLGNVL